MPLSRRPPEEGEALTLRCEAVIFDLDGVLVDSGPIIERAWEQLAAEFGFDLADIGGVLHGVRTVDALDGILSGSVLARAIDRMEEVEITLSHHARAVGGSRLLLDALPDHRWGIATSGSRALATARLEATGHQVPGIMITADDVARGKPDPAPYTAAAAALGIEPATGLVFEDAPSGARSATAAGLPVVGVATTHRAGVFDAVAWVNDLSKLDVLGADPLKLRIGYPATREVPPSSLYGPGVDGD